MVCELLNFVRLSVGRRSVGRGDARMIAEECRARLPQITMTALGADEFVEWSYANDAVECAKELKRLGVTIVGIEQTAKSIPLLSSMDLLEKAVMAKQSQSDDLKKQPSICLLFGNEVAGLSEPLLDQCDFVCDLPMRGQKNSLNVAISFGIVSYAVAEQFPSLVVYRKKVVSDVGEGIGQSEPTILL
eukprot:gene16664-19803_t